jgi:hypothetical protein
MTSADDRRAIEDSAASWTAQAAILQRMETAIDVAALNAPQAVAAAQSRGLVAVMPTRAEMLERLNSGLAS